MLSRLGSLRGIKSRVSRTLHLESLERRTMLSLSAVIDAAVAASSEGQAPTSENSTNVPADVASDTPTSPTLASESAQEAAQLPKIADVKVNENAADCVIRLGDVFDYWKDVGYDLKYRVIRDTNSSLFSLTDTNSVEETLTLAFAKNTSGEAKVTVEALSTDCRAILQTTFTVTVVPAATMLVGTSTLGDAPITASASEDASLAMSPMLMERHPPEISIFVCTTNDWLTWTASGSVTDPVDEPEALTLTFGGLLTGCTATVQANYTFSGTKTLEQPQEGLGGVEVRDSLGDTDAAFVWLCCP